MSGLSRTLSLAALAVFVAAACGGPPAAGTPTAGQPTATGGQPTAPGGQGATPTPQGATNPPGQPTPPPGGGGGAVFPDGVWTSGSAHIVVTGDYNQTNDLGLGGGLSGGGVTTFQYASVDQTVAFTVSVDADTVSIVISTPQYVGGGGTTTDAPCAANWTRKDANLAEATLQCTGAVVIGTSGAGGAQRINVQASFSATR